MNGIKLSGIALDRKVLADIAARDPESFTAIVDQARAALKAA
jgi:large subunit ribosomal protein L20